MPTVLQIEATVRCNLNCVMCNVPKNYRPDMRFEDYTHVIDQMENVKVVHFQGLGEPLIQKELPEFVLYAKRKGAASSVNTNGILLTEEALNRLIANGLEFLGVSIDSPFPENYMKIRRGANFKVLTENLDALKKTPLIKHTKVHTVVMLENLNDLALMPFFCHQHDIPSLYFQLQNEIEVNDKIRETVAHVEEICRDYKLAFFPLVPVEKIRRRCKWPWLATYIDINGNVFPCCIVPHVLGNHEDAVFGNIFKENFKEIWLGEKYVEFRRELKDGFPNICRGCHRYWLSPI